MILRVNEVGVDACLLELHLHELFNLLELGLLNSSFVLLVENLLLNALGVKGNGLHGSHLHGDEVTLLSSSLVGLYHRAESVLTHVVVYLHVVTLESQIAVKFHLLTGDT